MTAPEEQARFSELMDDLFSIDAEFPLFGQMAEEDIDEPEPQRYAQWDESKHPRGQPQNAGEFADESGGTATAEKTPPQATFDADLPAGTTAKHPPDLGAPVRPMTAERKVHIDKIEKTMGEGLTTKSQMLMSGARGAPLPPGFKAPEESYKLTPVQVANYKDGLHQVLVRMTDRSLEAIAKNVEGDQFYPDIHTLTVELAFLEKSLGKMPKNAMIAGAFDKFGKLHLDSASPKWIKQMHQGMTGVYAHELSHAIDKGDKVADSKEWIDAAWEEIVEGEHHLSRYAMSSQYEAWGEFGRLILQNPEVAKAHYPRCYKIWKDHGFAD